MRYIATARVAFSAVPLLASKQALVFSVVVLLLSSIQYGIIVESRGFLAVTKTR